MYQFPDLFQLKSELIITNIKLACMENSNHEPIKSDSLDYRKFLNSDLIVLGCFSTINFYILLVKGGIIDGIDGFLKSLSLFEVIGILLSIIMAQALIELYIGRINKSITAYLISRFIIGVLLMFIAYPFVIKTGGFYDNIIKDISLWDFLNLLSIEFMFFCISVAYEKVQHRRYQSKSSDDA